MGKRVAAFFLILIALSLSGVAWAGYYWELGKATRSGRLYSFETWDVNLMWHATFFNDNFRQAYEKRYAAKNHMDDAEKVFYVSEQERIQDSAWEFFISFYVKKDYKKFSMEADSFWHIHITAADGTKIDPIEIESIPITPYVKVMHPFLTRWSKAYRVRFPKVGLGDEFSLSLESVVGKSTLTWKNWADKKEKRRRKN